MCEILIKEIQVKSILSKLSYIQKNFPQHFALYQKIYLQGDKSYWENLDKQIKLYTDKNNLLYVRNQDNFNQSFDAPPIVVNFFYHEQIKKS